MHNLNEPNIEDINVFDTCVSVKARRVREKFQAARSTVDEAYKKYVELGKSSSLFQMETILPIENVDLTEDDFRLLYHAQFLNKRGPARAVYDSLKLSARRCPFCSHNIPGTLDHFLPKEAFAEFSIFSRNLVPCCRDCNGEKHSKVISEDEQFFHPYFDDISGGTWLICNIDYPDGNPSYFYSVDANVTGISKNVLKKLEYQFEKLGLNAIYGTQAVDEVEGQILYLRSLRQDAGQEEVLAFLTEQARSKEWYNANSWQAALYRGLVSDPHFSNMAWGS